MTDSINDAISQIVNAHEDRLESLAWEAMVDPLRRGIAVIEHPVQWDFHDDPERLMAHEYRASATQVTEMRLDARVPSMNIYRFTSHEAYDAWVERGCPTTTTEEPS